MGAVTAQAISLFHTDMPFSYRSGDYLFMTRKAEFLRSVIKQRPDFCTVRAVAAGASSFFDRQMLSFASGHVLLYIFVTFITECSHGFYGSSLKFARMGIMAGSAGFFPERLVHFVLLQF